MKSYFCTVWEAAAAGDIDTIQSLVRVLPTHTIYFTCIGWRFAWSRALPRKTISLAWTYCCSSLVSSLDPLHPITRQFRHPSATFTVASSRHPTPHCIACSALELAWGCDGRACAIGLDNQ